MAQISRRRMIQLLLSTPIAATLDVEKMLWIPGQMVTVPASPSVAGIVARTWEELVRQHSCDIFLASIDIDGPAYNHFVVREISLDEPKS